MSHSKSSLPEYLLIGLHLRYSGWVSLITFISQYGFGLVGFHIWRVVRTSRPDGLMTSRGFRPTLLVAGFHSSRSFPDLFRSVRSLPLCPFAPLSHVLLRSLRIITPMSLLAGRGVLLCSTSGRLVLLSAIRIGVYVVLHPLYGDWPSLWSIGPTMFLRVPARHSWPLTLPHRSIALGRSYHRSLQSVFPCVTALLAHHHPKPQGFRKFNKSCKFGAARSTTIEEMDSDQDNIDPPTLAACTAKLSDDQKEEWLQELDGYGVSF